MDPVLIPQEPSPEQRIPEFNPHHGISPQLFWILLLTIILVSTASAAIAFYVGKQTGESMTIEYTGTKTEPVLTTTLSQPPQTDLSTLKIQGSLQDFFKQTCRTDTTPHIISVQNLPWIIDSKLFQIIHGAGGFEAYCTSVEENNISKAMAVVSIAPDRSIVIYDQESEVFGHGPPPDFGLFGKTIFDQGDIKMSASLCCSEGPSLLNHTGILLRGIRTYKTQTGNMVSVALTNTGIDAKDSRLVEFLTPHTQPFGDNELEIKYENGLNDTVIDTFFGINLKENTPEAKAISQMETELRSLNAK